MRKRPDQIALTGITPETHAEMKTMAAVLEVEGILDKGNLSAYIRLLHRRFMKANPKLIEKYKGLLKYAK